MATEPYRFGPPDYEPDREGFIAKNPQIDWKQYDLVTGWDRLHQRYDYMILPKKMIEEWRKGNESHGN